MKFPPIMGRDEAGPLQDGTSGALQDGGAPPEVVPEADDLSTEVFCAESGDLRRPYGSSDQQVRFIQETFCGQRDVGEIDVSTDAPQFPNYRLQRR